MKVGICLAAQDAQSPWFGYDLASLIAASQQAGLEVRKYQATGTWLPQVRFYTARAALAAKCDALLFLDTDMRFPETALQQLLAREKDVVGANYVTRRAPIQPVAVELDGTRLYTEPEHTGLQAVGAVGLGCLLVRTSVFRSLTLPWFLLTWIPERQDYGGEDAYFCHKLSEAGHTIWIDQDLSQDVRHLGIIEFEHEHALHLRRSLQTAADAEEDG